MVCFGVPGRIKKGYAAVDCREVQQGAHRSIGLQLVPVLFGKAGKAFPMVAEFPAKPCRRRHFLEPQVQGRRLPGDPPRP